MTGDVKPYDTYGGVEELRYEENDPSPNYQTWLDQLTIEPRTPWLIFDDGHHDVLRFRRLRILARSAELYRED